MTTRAERKGDRWVLNGRKIWITGGPIADLFLCFATTDPPRGAGHHGVPHRARRRPASTSSARSPSWACAPPRWASSSSRTASCPPRTCWAARAAGPRIFNAAMEWERGAILASVVGTMRRQLERCIHHARTRKQFGQPIGKFQSVSNRIVDMMTRLETSRLLIYRYAWLKQQGKDATIAASMAKLHVSECFVQNSLDAVRLFGAVGLLGGGRPRARPPRQRRRRDLLGHQRHPARTSSPSTCRL